jgi:arsenate reductase
VTRRHWSFDDPSAAAGDEEQRLAVFRRVRDEIAARLRDALERDVTATASPTVAPPQLP